MRRPAALARIVVVVAILAGTGPLGPGAGPRTLAAQEAEAATGVGVDESGLLREAAAREEAGELEAASSLLRRVLAARPGSAPALLSLERVLRVQRRLDALPPLVAAGLAEEPRSSLLNPLLLRTLSALDRTDDLEAAGAAWIDAAPAVEGPYREVAAVWRERGELDRARRVLEAGRDRVARPDALALELGDLYAEMGEPELAVREWDRAVGPDGRGLLQVQRRMRARPDGGASMLEALVPLLAASPATPARLEAAVEVAVDAGLQDRAREIAAALLPAKTLEERSRYLSGVARRADAEGLDRLGYWAYGRLLETEEELHWVRERLRASSSAGDGVAGERDVQIVREAGDVGRLLALRRRLAELALAVGDTTAAATGFGDVEDALEPGSPARRQATAHRIALEAPRDVDGALAALRTFHAEFPDAPERDEVVAAVAAELMARGRHDEADALLAGVRGPRSALLRGRLALARGSLDAARTAYVTAASGLRGAEATRTLALATLLSRLSEAAGPALGEALGRHEAGETGAAVDGLLAALPVLPTADRAPLLALAAGMAEEAGLVEDARGVRRRLVAEHPHTPEAPAALLALARSLSGEAGGEAGGDSEARELLERLILEYPRSALVPQARRALERLGRDDGAGHPNTGSR